VAVAVVMEVSVSVTLRVLVSVAVVVNVSVAVVVLVSVAVVVEVPVSVAVVVLVSVAVVVEVSVSVTVVVDVSVAVVVEVSVSVALVVLVVVGVVVWFESPQQRIDATSRSSAVQITSSGFIKFNRDGIFRCLPASGGEHSAADQMISLSMLQPVPCTTSATISSSVHSRPPLLLHT
jgi:hypothetical protein